MKIIRSAHDKAHTFTRISNKAIRDERLSWKAKGILCFLLSCSEEWQLSASGLAEFATDGKMGIRSGLQELEDFDYLKKARIREKQGRFGAYDYTITEDPENFSPDDDQCPPVEKPEMENPPVDKPALEKSPLRTNNTKTNKEKTNNITTTTAAAVGGGGLDLSLCIFPEKLKSYRQDVEPILNRLANLDTVQQVLDVVAAKQNLDNPPAFLNALVTRAQQGTFDPTAGLKIAKGRARQAKIAEDERKREQAAQAKLKQKAKAKPKTKPQGGFKDRLKHGGVKLL